MALHQNPDEDSVLSLPDHEFEDAKALIDEVYAFLARQASTIVNPQ